MTYEKIHIVYERQNEEDRDVISSETFVRECDLDIVKESQRVTIEGNIYVLESLQKPARNNGGAVC